MMKKNLLFCGLVMTLFFVACDKDDPVVPNEEELITTVNYTLTPATGGAAIVMTFTDLDGDGGNAPTIVGGTLAANTLYNGTLELLNETETPAEDITEEIEEEDDEHQFFFETSIGSLSIAYNYMYFNTEKISGCYISMSKTRYLYI